MGVNVAGKPRYISEGVSCVALHLVCNVVLARGVSVSTWQTSCTRYEGKDMFGDVGSCVVEILAWP